MMKFLKRSNPLFRQKILLPGMMGTVRIEQTHKSIFDCRIEVVVEKSFPMFQADHRQHFFYRQFIVSNNLDQLKRLRVINCELVRYLSGQLVE